MIWKQQAVSSETEWINLNEVGEKVLKKLNIVAKYGISNSTLSTILRNRSKFKSAYAVSQFYSERKQMPGENKENI